MHEGKASVNDQQNRMKKICRTTVMVGLGILLLGGCDRLTRNFIGGSQRNSPDTTAPSAQDLICDTPNYVAAIIWQQEQPTFTFGPKSVTTTLTQATPVITTPNPDGSQTYEFQGETTAYARFYSDNTCFVQVVDAAGAVTLEENGQATKPAEGAEAVASEEVEEEPQPDRYQEGYDLGYRTAYKEGESFRQSNLGNHPDQAFQASALIGNEGYDRGYREGFNDGFADGYDSFISQEPNPNHLTLSCAGKIQDDLDFMAYYTRDSGFNRIDFKPHQSSQTLTSNLAYAGKDDQGRRLWQGNVAQMADVMLVHLSTAVPQVGDEISVRYDNRWGKGNCR